MAQQYDVTLRGHHLDLFYKFYVWGWDHYIWKHLTKKYSKRHADNTVKIFKRIKETDIRVKIIDTIDEICQTCKKKKKRACREFIPYGISNTSADRATIYHYGMIKRVYTSKYIRKRVVKERGLAFKP